MHELAIVKSLLEMVCENAIDNKVEKVRTVNIRIGELSGFVDDSVEFYWEIVARGTLASESKVIIERIDGRMKCVECSRIFDSRAMIENCVYCGSLKLLIVGGDELELVSISGDLSEKKNID